MQDKTKTRLPPTIEAFGVTWVPMTQLSQALNEAESLRRSLAAVRRVVLQESDPQIISRGRVLRASNGG